MTVTGGERRLEKAVAYVESYWLPLNKGVAASITQGLKDGRYDLDPTCLIDDLKGDPALFLSVVREASLGATVRYQSTRELLLAEGVRALRQLIAKPPPRHRLEGASREQVAILEATFLATTTTEMLGSRGGIDEALAYESALLHQLGLLLVAWNYPNVFDRAVKMQRSLEDALTELLGFSPQMLAARIVASWSVSTTSRHIIEGHVGATPEVELLNHLCDVGEALARANHPEIFTSAPSDWAFAESELTASLGDGALREIAERTERTRARYAAALPQLFPPKVEVDPSIKLRAVEESRTLTLNPFIAHCPLQLKKRLKEFYSKLAERPLARRGLAHDPRTKELLQTLVKEIVPYAGFTSGYVATVDPARNELVVRLKFGLPTLSGEPRPLLRAGMSDPLREGFECQAPLAGGYDDREVGYVTGPLGNERKIGVLYAEFPRILALGNDVNPVLHFKAVRLALEHCLALD